ncbi:MAG: helix-turn-helix transcriptional regulator [Microcystis sp. M152S2]|nr:helix-turn-helix transcriptional regulator [Microcystis sp. M152S2]
MEVVSSKVLIVKGLGEKIKLAREADPRPLTTICKIMNMSSNNWYRIEKEAQTLPLDTLRKIENVLGVDFGVSLD